MKARLDKIVKDIEVAISKRDSESTNEELFDLFKQDVIDLKKMQERLEEQLFKLQALRPSKVGLFRILTLLISRVRYCFYSCLNIVNRFGSNRNFDTKFYLFACFDYFGLSKSTKLPNFCVFAYFHIGLNFCIYVNFAMTT